MYHKCDLVKCQILQKCNLNDRCTVKCFKLYTSKGFNIYSLFTMIFSEKSSHQKIHLSVVNLDSRDSLQSSSVSRCKSRLLSIPLQQFFSCSVRHLPPTHWWGWTFLRLHWKQFLLPAIYLFLRSRQLLSIRSDNLDLWNRIDNIYIY